VDSLYQARMLIKGGIDCNNLSPELLLSKHTKRRTVISTLILFDGLVFRSPITYMTLPDYGVTPSHLMAFSKTKEQSYHVVNHIDEWELMDDNGNYVIEYWLLCNILKGNWSALKLFFGSCLEKKNVIPGCIFDCLSSYHVRSYCEVGNVPESSYDVDTKLMNIQDYLLDMKNKEILAGAPLDFIEHLDSLMRHVYSIHTSMFYNENK